MAPAHASASAVPAKKLTILLPASLYSRCVLPAHFPPGNWDSVTRGFGPQMLMLSLAAGRHRGAGEKRAEAGVEEETVSVKGCQKMAPGVPAFINEAPTFPLGRGAATGGAVIS